MVPHSSPCYQMNQFLSGNEVLHVLIYTTCKHDWLSPITCVPEVHSAISQRKVESEAKSTITGRRGNGQDKMRKLKGLIFLPPPQTDTYK